MKKLSFQVFVNNTDCYQLYAMYVMPDDQLDFNSQQDKLDIMHIHIRVHSDKHFL